MKIYLLISTIQTLINLIIQNIPTMIQLQTYAQTNYENIYRPKYFLFVYIG